MVLIRKLVAVVTLDVLRFESSSLHFVVRYGFTHRKKFMIPVGNSVTVFSIAGCSPQEKKVGFWLSWSQTHWMGAKRKVFL